MWHVATPLWGKCEVTTHTPKNGTWESSGTFENSERNYKGQNTSHWGVFYTLGKFLKCRCLKWHRMNHLDICTIAKIYVVEFQKRGLPHAHILIFFTEDCKPHTVEDVDRIISAELPNSETNKLAHETVVRCTMHGPCGAAFPNAPCMEEGKCKK